jgi:hypothetical protein
MNPDGTGERILFPDGAYDEDLHWAPDGSGLLFARFPFPVDSLGEGLLS